MMLRDASIIWETACDTYPIAG